MNDEARRRRGRDQRGSTKISGGSAAGNEAKSKSAAAGRRNNAAEETVELGAGVGGARARRHHVRRATGVRTVASGGIEVVAGARGVTAELGRAAAPNGRPIEPIWLDRVRRRDAGSSPSPVGLIKQPKKRDSNNQKFIKMPTNREKSQKKISKY